MCIHTHGKLIYDSVTCVSTDVVCFRMLSRPYSAELILDLAEVLGADTECHISYPEGLSQETWSLGTQV